MSAVGRVVIHTVSIAAGSGIDARRLADGLTPALERALIHVLSGAPPLQAMRPGAAERAASQIAEAIAARTRDVA